MKKLWSFILTLVMIFSCMPAVYAAGYVGNTVVYPNGFENAIDQVSTFPEIAEVKLVSIAENEIRMDLKVGNPAGEECFISIIEDSLVDSELSSTTYGVDYTGVDTHNFVTWETANGIDPIQLSSIQGETTQVTINTTFAPGTYAIFIYGTTNTYKHYIKFTIDTAGNLAAPYALKADPSNPDKLNLGSFTYDVGENKYPTTKAITLSNVGMEPLGEIKIELKGTSPEAFQIDKASITSLATGAGVDVTVTPSNSGINLTEAGGLYQNTTFEAEVNVSNASISAVVKIPVTMTVKPGTQTAPTGITTQAVSGPTNKDGKIGNVTDKMEYSTDASVWTMVGNGKTEIIGLAEGNYKVRYAKVAATKKNPSPAAEVSVGGAYSLTGDTITTTYGAAMADYDLKTKLVTASGDKTGVTFIKTAGEFPAGISMTADGVISGKPTQVTNASVTIEAKDSNNSNATVSAVYTIEVKAEKPSAVQNLGATAGDSKFTIKWDAPANPGSDNVWYDIVVTHKAITTTPSTIVSYTTTGGTGTITLPNVDKNKYLKDNGDSTWTLTIGGVSITASAVTETPTTVSSSSITTDVAVGTTQSGLTRDVSGTNGTTYYFAVKAVNSEGAGPVIYGSATPVATPAPTPSPSKGGGGSGSVNWTVTYDAGSHGKITSGSKTETISKTADKPYPSKVPTVTANSGYKFMGWSLDGKTVLDPKDQKISASTKFIAVYQRQGESHGKYMNGYPDGTFHPDGQVTRAEVTTMMSQLIGGYDANGNYDSSLADVWDDWYTNFINYCVSKGLITGYEDGSFRPNADITRAEFATIVAKYLNLPNEGTSASADAAGHWAEGYISQLQAKGIISGYEDGTIRPDAKITRAEAVTMLNRAFSRQPLSSAVRDNKDNYTVSLSDVNTDHWAYYEILEAAVEHIDADFHKTEQ